MRYALKLSVIISFFILFLTKVNTVYASTYYVSTIGSDSANGAIATPWKTIQKAANTMTAGDTVLIHAGSYHEKVTPAKSGSSSGYITYKSFGDGEVVIDGDANRDNCIYVSGKSYLQFIDLHLTNTGYGGMKAPFAAYAGSSNLILDTIKSDKGRFGILLHGNNTASEDASGAVKFVTIKNSTIHTTSSYGIFVYYKVTDSLIQNNLIYNDTSENLPSDDQYGIDLDTDYPGGFYQWSCAY